MTSFAPQDGGYPVSPTAQALNPELIPDTLTVPGAPAIGEVRYGLTNLLDLTQQFATEQRTELDTVLQTADPEGLQMVFGALVQHYAGKRIDPSATPSEWARSVEAAFQSLSAKPDTVKGIASVAFGHTLHCDQGNQVAPRNKLPSDEQKKYERFVAMARSEGFIRHEELATGPPVLLEYEPTYHVADGQDNIQPVVQLLVRPRPVGTKYVGSSFVNNKSDLKHRVDWPTPFPSTLLEVFDRAEGKLGPDIAQSISQLTERKGEVISLGGGGLRQGQELIIGYKFTHPTAIAKKQIQELQSLSLEKLAGCCTAVVMDESNLKLVQAYFRGDTDYPIF